MRGRFPTFAIASCIGIAVVCCATEKNSGGGCPQGKTESCLCPNSEDEGTRICDDQGRWSTCLGCESTGACTPGNLMKCTCEDGGEGLQECLEDGEDWIWGPCEGCHETDTRQNGNDETDSETSSNPGAEGGTDTVQESGGTDTAQESGGTDTAQENGGTDTVQLGECDYAAACIGDVCDTPDDCCDNAGCNSAVFSAEWGASENYCYPLCDPTLDDSDSCKCDDVCLDFGEGFATCLSIGNLVIDNLSLSVGADYETLTLMEASDVTFELELAGESIPMDLFYAYWDEDDETMERFLVIRSEGLFGTDGIWILIVTIPEAVMASGEGSYPWYDEANDVLNFSIDLYSGTLSGDTIEEVWMETLTYDAALMIDKVCDPCTSEDPEMCEVCEFSIGATLFAMRTKLAL